MKCKCGNVFQQADKKKDDTCSQCLINKMLAPLIKDPPIVRYDGGEITSTFDQLWESAEQARVRVEQQVYDAVMGNERALNTNGQRQRLETRSLSTRCWDMFRGCLAECLIAPIVKTVWSKPLRQYNGGKEPDLIVKLSGQTRDADVRVATRDGTVPYRNWMDDYKFQNHPDEPFMTITNLCYNKNCRAGWAYKRDIFKAYLQYKDDWSRSNFFGSYHAIPFEQFSSDFSCFEPF